MPDELVGLATGALGVRDQPVTYHSNEAARA